MRIIIILSLLTTGCATPAWRSYNQDCASRGMALSGVTTTTGDATHLVGGRLMASDYEEEQVSCHIPKSDYEQCMIRAHAESLKPLQDYNEWIGAKRTLTGLLYFPVVLPGVGLKLYFDKQREVAYKESESIERKIASECLEFKK
jgi:hypothetical protein